RLQRAPHARVHALLVDAGVGRLAEFVRVQPEIGIVEPVGRIDQTDGLRPRAAIAEFGADAAGARRRDRYGDRRLAHVALRAQLVVARQPAVLDRAIAIDELPRAGAGRRSFDVLAAAGARGPVELVAGDAERRARAHAQPGRRGD